MTSSNGNVFRVTDHFCSPGTGEFPAQGPVTRSFDVFFDLRLNKRSSKQLWGWWFETPSRPLLRQRNDDLTILATRARYFLSLVYLLWWCRFFVCKVNICMYGHSHSWKSGNIFGYHFNWLAKKFAESDFELVTCVSFLSCHQNINIVSQELWPGFTNCCILY